MQMRKKPDIPTRVLSFISRHNLLSNEDSVLVAVSGGPDSLCLLHVLTTIAHGLNISIAVAHFNHLLRGEESRADAEFVSKIAEELGLPLVTGEGDVRAFSRKHRCPIEEAAREMRYSFLAQAVKSGGYRAVAVGHNADDQVETILLHLIRGSGLQGLTGMSPSFTWKGVFCRESVRLIRPLLEITRQEIEIYCSDNRLEPRQDFTNLSTRYLRNRVRRELLPLLERYNPRIKNSLTRLADIVSDDLCFIEQTAEEQWSRIVIEEENSIKIDRTQLLNLPLSIQRQVLRRAVEKMLHNLRDIELKHIDYLRERIGLITGKKLNLPFGLTAYMEYNYLVLRPSEGKISPFPPLEEEYTLSVPGETALPGWKVLTRYLDRGDISSNSDNRLTINDKELNFTAYFDRAMLLGPLTVRSRRKGDRFKPLGMEQDKSLHDFMVDQKIPSSWRPDIPLLFCKQKLIWVVGWRISGDAKIVADTERVLSVQFVPFSLK